MKLLALFFIALFVSGCSYFQKSVEITGTAPGMDGGIVSILDLAGQPVYTAVVSDGKFHIKPQALANTGYYTFSISLGKYPRDFDIYIEPGKYTIDIPKSETDYLSIKSNSKTQGDLSAYYIYENSMLYGFRHTIDSLNAAITNPKGGNVYDLMKKVASARARANGATTAIMDMFITKYPKNTIIPHVISVEDYKSNPFPYYYVFQKLSPAVKSSEEGKKIGKTLDSLNKVQDEQIKKPMPVKQVR